MHVKCKSIVTVISYGNLNFTPTIHLQSTNIQLQGANSTIVEHEWNTSIILV